jgi:ABC-2 type transport system ATP-binding protein
VAIMDHGRILALDTPAALKRSIDADTIVRVHTDGATQSLAEALGRMGGATHADAVDGEVRVYLRGVTGALPRVVDAAEAAGFTVTDLSITEPTLETVFITLTGKDLRE